MKPLRIYVDTSVFGGCFDEEFSADSERFFENVKRYEHIIIMTDTLKDELAKAPEDVRKILTLLKPESLLEVLLTEDVLSLRDEYVKAGIARKSSIVDATHIAAATVFRADVLAVGIFGILLT